MSTESTHLEQHDPIVAEALDRHTPPLDATPDWTRVITGRGRRHFAGKLSGAIAVAALLFVGAAVFVTVRKGDEPGKGPATATPPTIEIAAPDPAAALQIPVSGNPRQVAAARAVLARFGKGATPVMRIDFRPGDGSHTANGIGTLGADDVRVTAQPVFLPISDNAQADWFAYVTATELLRELRVRRIPIGVALVVDRDQVTNAVGFKDIGPRGRPIADAATRVMNAAKDAHVRVVSIRGYALGTPAIDVRIQLSSREILAARGDRQWWSFLDRFVAAEPAISHFVSFEDTEGRSFLRIFRYGPLGGGVSFGPGPTRAGPPLDIWDDGPTRLEIVLGPNPSAKSPRRAERRFNLDCASSRFDGGADPQAVCDKIRTWWLTFFPPPSDITTLRIPGPGDGPLRISGTIAGIPVERSYGAGHDDSGAVRAWVDLLEGQGP